jgi:hypothetical protein
LNEGKDKRHHRLRQKFRRGNTQQEKSVHDMILLLDKTTLICFGLEKKHFFISFPSPRLAVHPVHNIELIVKLTACSSPQSLQRPIHT